MTSVLRFRFPVTFFCSRRCLSQKSLDSYFGPSTKGILDSWIQKYEDFVGLTQVREAQAQVLEVNNINNYIYLPL
jgi:hypothetical protein